MLEYFLIRPQKNDLTVSLHGGLTPESRDFQVAGDISRAVRQRAAFWLVAAAAQPRARLLIKNIGLN